MEQTTHRFEIEIKREPKVLEYSFQYYPWLKELVKNYQEDSTAFHDYKIIFNNGKDGLVEIQITHYGESERAGFRRYGDVRLDLISSFNLTDKCCKSYKLSDKRWKTLKNKDELKQFTSICPVKKWGKLVTCDAHYFYFAVLDKKDHCHLFNIYDNQKLKSQVNYFVNTYGVKINHKIGEPWGSAFVPVSEDDKVLRNCLITTKEGFLKIL
ncbi:hypothetical protein ACFLSX_01185 [Calditrichota bacterium]